MPDFAPAAELAKERGITFHRAELKCTLCGEGAEPVCWKCLDATIVTAVERMVKEGKLDAALERVLARRLRHGSVNEPKPGDHELVDETSGEILD